MLAQLFLFSSRCAFSRGELESDEHGGLSVEPQGFWFTCTAEFCFIISYSSKPHCQIQTETLPWKAKDVCSRTLFSFAIRTWSFLSRQKRMEGQFTKSSDCQAGSTARLLNTSSNTRALEPSSLTARYQRVTTSHHCSSYKWQARPTVVARVKRPSPVLARFVSLLSIPSGWVGS